MLQKYKSYDFDLPKHRQNSDMTYLPVESRMFEYICDYVDGDMDDSIREVFEEYLSQNRDMQKFVAEAKRSREYLSRLPVPDLDYSRREALKNELKIRFTIEERTAAGETQDEKAPQMPASRVSRYTLLFFAVVTATLIILAVLF